MFKVFKESFELNIFEVGMNQLDLANKKMKEAKDYKAGMQLFNHEIVKPKVGQPILYIEYGCQM